MIVAILAGGMGTRLSEETSVRPKPMVEIGGRPILWHIMKGYSHFGHREFAIALGYKGDVIKEYFLNYANINSDVTVDLKTGAIERRSAPADDWRVHLQDTGLASMTGGRIKRLKQLLGRSTFMMTYGDGVSNVDIARLLDFHRSHGKLATVTAVRPPARYGTIETTGNRVVRFTEKVQTGEGWINGGYFVLEPGAIDYIDADETHWEREPLERLATDGQLMVYRHEDFWQSMDTLRDVRLLNSLWSDGTAPWKTWEG